MTLLRNFWRGVRYSYSASDAKSLCILKPDFGQNVGPRLCRTGSLNVRFYSPITAPASDPELIANRNFFTRFIHNIKSKISTTKNMPKKKVEKYALEEMYLSAGVPKLYGNCANGVDFLAFIERYNLPDTIHSWVKVSMFHMWIVLTRICHEDVEFYNDFRDDLVELFWKDIHDRMTNIKNARALSGITRKSIREYLNTCYYLMWLTYVEMDEALLSDDTELAAALWRNLLDKNESYDVTALNNLVKYTRYHVHHLQSVSLHDLVKNGITWKFV